MPVTGTIQTTDPTTDTYAVIDPREGIDGWRSVANVAARNAIPALRRRKGMIVVTQNDLVAYIYNGSTWDVFGGGSGGGNPSTFSWQLAFGTDAEVVSDPTEWQICTFSGTFSKVSIAAKTAPTGAAFVIDILLSSDDGATWASLWATTPGDRPSLAIGSKRGEQTTFETSSFTTDDLIRIDIIQVGSTVPGKNIRVVLVA